MSKTTAAERNYHAKMYIDAVFAETLKQEGFVNPDGKSISWYRVVNNELVHAVYFHATYGSVPVQGMCIESRVFPLFYKPMYYSSIYTSGSNRHFGYRVMGINDLPDEHGTRLISLYSNDIWVYTIVTGKKGLYTLEVDVLPWFQKAMTQADYYQLVSDEFVKLGNDFDRQVILSDAVALTLYYGDTEKYAAYSQWFAGFLPGYLENVLIADKYKEERLALKSALDGDTREEFLQQLERGREKTIKWLKKMGIPV